MILCIRVTFPNKMVKVNEVNDDYRQTLIVEPFTIENRGPYPYNQPKR